MRRVTIHNFQSHKDIVLDLSPTVNSLEGVSDSGKSAILRAMLWCLTNKPDGVAFASNWANDKKGKLKDEVSVSIDNITRFRTSTVNGYAKYIGGTEPQTYEALKGTVPPDIENAINIGSVNVQRQMDPPFLLSSTPGDAARYVNELIGLEEIDTYQKALKGKAHDTATSLKDESKRLADAEASLSQYDWVEGAEKKVAELTAVDEQCNALECDLVLLAGLDEVTGISATLVDAGLNYAQAGDLINAYPDTAKLEGDVDLLKQAEEVASLDAQLASNKMLVQAASEKIKELAAIDTASLESALYCLTEGLNSDESVCDELFPALRLLPKLESRIQVGTEISVTVSALEADIAAITEFENIVAGIEDTQNALLTAEKLLEGKTCPVCGKPL